MADSELSTRELCQALDKLQPGFLPSGVFYSISRLTVLTAAEMVPLRRRADGGFDVLLTRRPDDDPFFARLMHCPGQIFRPGDSLASRPREVLRVELPNTQILSEPAAIPDSWVYDYGRGPVIERVHYVMVGDSTDGDFYDVNHLPADLLQGHDHLIKIVLDYIANNERR